MYSQGQSCAPEGATIATIESPSQNSASSSSPELVEHIGPSSSSSSAEEGQTTTRLVEELTRHMVLKVIFAEVDFSLSS